MGGTTANCQAWLDNEACGLDMYRLIVKLIRMDVTSRAKKKRRICFFLSGVPGGLVGGPRADYDQFHGFEFYRVHTRRDFLLRKNGLLIAESARA